MDVFCVFIESFSGLILSQSLIGIRAQARPFPAGGKEWSYSTLVLIIPLYLKQHFHIFYGI